MSDDVTITLANRAIYYWDWYMLKGEKDNLVAAAAFMQSYRLAGGTDYVETEQAILAACDAVIIKPLLASPEVKTRREVGPVFGMTFEQIRAKQQKQ
jgi:hypothetical protein